MPLHNETGGFHQAPVSDPVKIIASIEDPAVIQKTLAHLDVKATSVAALLPDCRASLAVGLFV